MSKENNTIVSDKDLNTNIGKLIDKRIFFGHQSVGFNIIKGMHHLIDNHSTIKLKIIHTKSVAEFAGSAMFAHSSIGRNMYPISKIEAFFDIMESGIGEKVDIAFLKFCYVDITKKTDVPYIFGEYKKNIKELEEKFPKVKFVHFTVPLTSKPTGTEFLYIWCKNFIKKIMGRLVFDYHDNIKRNEYNKLIIQEYQKSGLLFDLAKIESTFPDGSRAVFKKHGETYYYLVHSYSNDGGHLNNIGSEIVGQKLLTFLANIK